ncbi:MAG: hypothetical protein HY370_05205 [Proteobacteria bacterium]|nr:hypothetical protein [Pseudomonadota bacterium]
MNIGRATLLLIIVFLSGFSQPAGAQMCSTPFEAIITLHPPQLGVPTVWDAKYSRDGKHEMVQLFSGVPKDGGTVFAVGRTVAQAGFRPLDLVLLEMNRRGRVLNEKFYPLKEAEVPVKMIVLKKGDYLVVSNIRGWSSKERRQVRLSWYSSDGSFRSEKVIDDSDYDYDAAGLVHAADDDGFVLIVHAVNRSQESDQHGMLMRFTAGGQQAWSRAYRPGIPNRIEGLSDAGDGGYVAAGRIKIDDGRNAGWVMKLGYDGTVLWQRIFPRGAGAVLSRAAHASAMSGHEGQGFILLGTSAPLDGGADAAWLMAVDALGEPQWQRYFRHPDFSFSSIGVDRIADGRVTVIVNAKAVGGRSHRGHVRMLVLSPRGVIIGDEAYIEGVQADGKDYVPGWNGERIVTATIESDSRSSGAEMIGDNFLATKSDDVSGEKTDAAQKNGGTMSEGWIFVATALDPYDDPCMIKRAAP